MADNNKEFVDERGYLKQLIDYLIGGVSPSEYKSAHEDIDKLIARADANAKYAKLFDFQEGRHVNAVYRHLAPDSTVSLRHADADIYYNAPEYTGKSLSDYLYGKAQSNPLELDQTSVARMLARLRGGNYKPMPK